eukprot:scaffold113090_cov37-Tisochrysis_lutea.AAC.3
MRGGRKPRVPWPRRAGAVPVLRKPRCGPARLDGALHRVANPSARDGREVQSVGTTNHLAARMLM